ncbi:MAG: hypothetical protein WAM30_17610 [Candidatus Dormiibacterota bacterium]
MLFTRSSLPTMRRVALLVAGALLLAGAGVLLMLHGEPFGSFVVLFGVCPIPLAVQQSLQARRLRSGRLGIYRDRLVLLQEKREDHVRWSEVETATLGDRSEWATLSWPAIKLTERLTIAAGGRAIRFRPADLGLAPVACRDLVLVLRDDPRVRSRLPAFDPTIPILRQPRRTGDLLRPRL